MTELDFDELDKAVNSLMADNGTPGISTPSTVTTATAATPSASVTMPSPAVRRRGQFMDVMHPSANMRPTSAPIKGHGLTIVPPTMAAATTPDMELVSPPADTPLESIAPLEIVPTPLSEDVTQENSDDTSSPTESESSNALNELVISEDTLSSPFLPDAKVEKRPLGSSAPLVDQEASAVDSDSIPSVENSTEQTVAEPEKAEEVRTEVPLVSAPLPDELKEDVVAVEANEVVHGEASTSDVSTQEVPSATAVPTAGGNIVQQYEEQPSTGDLTNGAIFDTSTYHQALDTQPAKKKSRALMWVLWIVVLLIVGATAGAAWFYFTTQ
ncbi:MAG: hypothetical protein ABIP74_00475 [Candidatus Saccharimonas sp.]